MDPSLLSVFRQEWVWSTMVANAAIGIAYLIISITLYLLIRNLKASVKSLFSMFCLTFAACGLSHWIAIFAFWHQAYGLAALIKVVIGTTTLISAVLLVFMGKKITALANEIKGTNEALREQRQMIAHSSKMATLGEMSGNIAHEINTPLGIISMNCGQLQELLRAENLNRSVFKRSLEQIESTTFRIAKIVKSLKLFARDGKNDPMLKISVQSILEDVFSMCRMRFKNHGVLLDCPVVNPDLSIECQRVQISQVLLNLLSNAFDAVEEVADKRVRIEVEEQLDSVEIAVSDSGNGIDPLIQEKIMQPFFTTKQSGRGTGLGLSLSNSFVQLHHGNLRFLSLSQGTKFVISLPKTQPIAKDEREAA